MEATFFYRFYLEKNPKFMFLKISHFCYNINLKFVLDGKYRNKLLKYNF